MSRLNVEASLIPGPGQIIIGGANGPVGARLGSTLLVQAGGLTRQRANKVRWTLATDSLTPTTNTGLTVSGGLLAASVAGTAGTATLPWWNQRTAAIGFRVTCTKATVSSRSTVGVANLSTTGTLAGSTFSFEYGYVQGVGICLWKGGSSPSTSNVLVADSAITDGDLYDIGIWIDAVLAPASQQTPNQIGTICTATKVADGTRTQTNFYINRSFYPTIQTFVARTTVGAGAITNLIVSASGGSDLTNALISGENTYANVAGVTGETFWLWRPATSNGRLVIACHGHGSTPTDSGWNNTAIVAMWQALVAAGFTVAVPNMGGNLWGNPTAQALLATLRDSLCAELVLDQQVFLWGTSMGAGAALTAIAKQTFGAGNVAAAYLAQSVTDLSLFWSNPSFTTLPAAYSNDATLRDASNPMAQPATAYTVPLLMCASAADTTANKAANTDAFVTKVGSNAPITVITVTGNHNDPSEYRPSDGVGFFKAYC